MNPSARYRAGTSRLAELVRWESRLAYGRWSAGRSAAVVCFMAGTVGLMMLVWDLASQRQEWLSERYTPAAETHRWAVLLLASTPFRDPVLNLEQTNAGYVALRIALFGVLFLVKFLLPAVAAGSIGKDRHSGRLNELRTTILSSSSVFLAKAIAISSAFLLYGAVVLAPFSVIAFTQGTSFWEVGRLWQELVATVAATVGLSLFCSAAARSAWFARVNAYLLLWVAVPLAWYAVNLVLKTQDTPYLMGWGYEAPEQNPASFTTLCWIHASLCWVVFLVCWWVVSVKLFGDPFWGTLRRKFGSAISGRRMAVSS